MAASFVFHVLEGNVNAWPEVFFIAIFALLADAALNLLLVVLAWHVSKIGTVRQTLRSTLGEKPLPFLMSYSCLGLAALILAVVYRSVGNWALVGFLIPVVLARQAFVESAQLAQMASAISEKSKALLTVSEKIVDERRDERLAVAAGLHDELLPPLYKVHLMGQVLRRDLATGRLLNLEDDLPELLGATEEASQATQSLIRNLRRSAIGPDGLTRTLDLLVRDTQAVAKCNITLRIEEVGGSPVVQLLAYQVAREALRNAVQHSQAKNVAVALMRDPPDMRLVVEDDGRGFDPHSVDEEAHFGLRLMRERVELAGGVMHVESGLGRGTRILVRLPAETSAQTR